ncbi:CPBP family intramembrane glutamic endopeptidase [Novosphingobium lentum]|uniref:CPBP family intramembrane glutamic endopeptidase n=1 Tax=Novosphingobium lentum TaxID=145287 RepID=UPI000836BF6B|nr:CPBP family intramembrane glutamic endopeptidase [Novosphingobium lentum]
MKQRLGRAPTTQLALIAAVAFLGLEAIVKLMPHLDTASLPLALLREAVVVAFAIGLAFVVVRIHTFSARELGFVAPNWSTFAWGFVAAVAMVVVSIAMIAAMHVFGVRQSAAMLSALSSRPVWMILLIGMVAAVSEEILFRSILITHLGALTGKLWVGAVLSLALFGLAHLSGWGVSQVFFAGVAGIIPTVMFVWKRDIGICMIAHFMTDSIGLLAAAAQAHAA